MGEENQGKSKEKKILKQTGRKKRKHPTDPSQSANADARKKKANATPVPLPQYRTNELKRHLLRQSTVCCGLERLRISSRACWYGAPRVAGRRRRRVLASHLTREGNTRREDRCFRLGKGARMQMAGGGWQFPTEALKKRHSVMGFERRHGKACAS